MTTRLLLAVILVITNILNSTEAKAPTAQITITGPKLGTPLNVTDSKVVSAHVWMGNFADWKSGPVNTSADEPRPYLLHFWVRLNPDDIRLMYVLEYRWLDGEGRGSICLPGRNSKWYSTNVYSILRNGQDGNCYYAEAEWGRAVQAVLSEAV